MRDTPLHAAPHPRPAGHAGLLPQSAVLSRVGQSAAEDVTGERSPSSVHYGDMGSSPDRAALREALRLRYPWLDAVDYGPRGVEAGECDRCHVEPRMVLTCGPGAALSLGRRCALRLGAGAWCVGHAGEAEEALAWLGRLPDEADDVARLWWVATGEVRLDPGLLERGRERGLPVPTS